MPTNDSRVTQTPFLMIPLWVWDCTKSAPTVLTAYMELRALVFVGADRTERKAQLVRTIMDRTGLGRTAVYSSLQSLEQMGAIEWRPGDRLFLPLDPPSATADDLPAASATTDGSSADVDKSSATTDATSSIEGEENQVENTSSPSSDVEALCADLAERVGKHQGSPRPPVTDRWRKDMRLLLERGPLHQETPAPMPVERVAGTIAYIFERMAEPQPPRGFCWAAQVRSPGALRDHWHQMAAAAERERRAKRGASAAAIDRVMAREAPGEGTLFTPPASRWGARAALGAGR